MKVQKVQKIQMTTQMKVSYKGQQNVRRLRESKGGYEQIIFATDQDLD